jgi:peptidoglycan/xylan/chitin deacetylase (PgdA/CDA1 family)
MSTALILLYHRVTQLPLDPQLLCVSPENFEEHLRILNKYYNPVSLQDLIELLGARKIQRRSVVITFDDGYADNLYNAKSLLERYSIPATVFVTTGNIGLGCEFWWDEVERIFLLPGKLPKELSLIINSQEYHRNLGKASEYTEQDYRRFRQWNVLEAEIPTERHTIYLALCKLLRDLPVKQRNAIVSAIRTWSGKPAGRRQTHMALSADEVRQLAAGGLVGIGGHTVNHPVLGSISQEEQTYEIHQSKFDLEAILGYPIRSFSYPFGGRSDYSLDTVRITKEAEFGCACSNFPGKVQYGTDPYQLPRFLVRNWTGSEFERRLKTFWSH